MSLDLETTVVLAAHRARCDELAASWATVSSSCFLFSHDVDFSTPWRPNYATLAFGRLRDELGLDGVTLHHLRHFSATQLLTLGIDIRTVSGRLGHANASTTLDIYSHFVEQGDDRAADVIGRLLGVALGARRIVSEQRLPPGLAPGTGHISSLPAHGVLDRSFRPVPLSVVTHLDPVHIDRATGALLGLASGDALGAGYEFQSDPQADPEMIGGGPFGLRTG